MPTPTLSDWMEGIRLRTLPVSLAPVLAGTGAAATLAKADAGKAVLAALVALFLQIGVNLANDYSDGIRGTDAKRVGPQRLTASGVVPPRTVRASAFAAFAVASGFGVWLVVSSGQWWLLAVGVVCVLAAWWYTGGKHPYGYAGLGEVSVFIFFGIVATCGTTYTQAGTVPAAGWWAGAGIGCYACAVLMANNLRDLPTDREVGKRTLAVRLGDTGARWAYTALIAAAASGITVASAASPWDGAPFVAGALTFLVGTMLSRRVLDGAQGTALIATLRDTGFLELTTGALLLILLALPR